MTFDPNAYERLWSLYRTYVDPPPPKDTSESFTLPSGKLWVDLSPPYKQRWRGFKNTYESLQIYHGYHVAKKLIDDIKRSPQFMKELNWIPEEVETNVMDRIRIKWKLPTKFEDITGAEWSSGLRYKCMVDKWADLEIRHHLRTMFWVPPAEKPTVDTRKFDQLMSETKTAQQWGLVKNDTTKRTLLQTMAKYNLTIEERIAALRTYLPNIAEAKDEEDDWYIMGEPTPEEVARARNAANNKSASKDGMNIPEMLGFLTKYSTKEWPSTSTREKADEDMQQWVKKWDEQRAAAPAPRAAAPPSAPASPLAAPESPEKRPRRRTTFAQQAADAFAQEAGNVPSPGFRRVDEEASEDEETSADEDNASSSEEEGAGADPPWEDKTAIALDILPTGWKVQQRSEDGKEFKYRLVKNDGSTQMVEDYTDDGFKDDALATAIGTYLPKEEPTSGPRRSGRTRAKPVNARYEEERSAKKGAARLKAKYEEIESKVSTEVERERAKRRAREEVLDMAYSSSEESNMTPGYASSEEMASSVGYSSSEESNMVSSGYSSAVDVSSAGYSSSEELSSGESRVVSSRASVASEECTQIYDPSKAKDDDDDWMAADENFRTNTSYLDRDGVPLKTGNMITYTADGLSRTLMILETVREGNALISTDFKRTFLQDMTSRAELRAQGMGNEAIERMIEQRLSTNISIKIDGNRLVGVTKI